MSQAGWKHRALIIALFLVAVGFAVIGFGWPWIKEISPIATAVITKIASSPISWFVVIMAVVVTFIMLPHSINSTKNAVDAKPIPTSVRLQFHPNSIIPTSVHVENIWYWYTLCNMFTANEAPTKKNPSGNKITLKICSVFIVFDKPVSVKQILVDGNGAVLPLVEVKNSGPRHAVITISGDVGSAIIDFKVVV